MPTLSDGKPTLLEVSAIYMLSSGDHSLSACRQPVTAQRLLYMDCSGVVLSAVCQLMATVCQSTPTVCQSTPTVCQSTPAVSQSTPAVFQSTPTVCRSWLRPCVAVGSNRVSVDSDRVPVDFDRTSVDWNRVLVDSGGGCVSWRLQWCVSRVTIRLCHLCLSVMYSFSFVNLRVGNIPHR